MTGKGLVMKKTGHTQIFLRILVGVTLCKVDANKIFSSVCFMNPLWRVPYSNHGLSVTKVQCPHLQNRNLSQGTGRISWHALKSCLKDYLFESCYYFPGLIWKCFMIILIHERDHPTPQSPPPSTASQNRGFQGHTAQRAPRTWPTDPRFFFILLLTE